jgi:hypothetical protein
VHQRAKSVKVYKIVKEVALAAFFYGGALIKKRLVVQVWLCYDDFFLLNNPTQKPISSIMPNAINAIAPFTVPMK